jgi:NAD(P)-dependent dehydrogenase (short-subunit alcohol dehydrogenase family)
MPTTTYRPPNLKNRVALVAGATRGAGRGIAIALGEAGATVYCTGRSTKRHRATAGRPETIEETAALVNAAGGHGIALRVDHTEPAQVRKLIANIKKRHKGLDILVNDIWGGDSLTEFGKRLWQCDLENGLLLLQQALHSHIITSYYAAPLLLGRRHPILFEITDGDTFHYRGNFFYDLVKTSVIRLAFAMYYEMRKYNVVSIALTPGFLRSEAMLQHYRVTEANWRDVGKRKKSTSKNPDDAQAFLQSESPRFVGRALAALAADPKVKQKSGRVFSSWILAREYGFTDVDGTRPDWGKYATKTYGKYKICDDTFYSYWTPGLIDVAFPNWF